MALRWILLGFATLSGGTACSLTSLPARFDRAVFLVRGDDGIIVGERTDRVGTTVFAFSTR